LIHKDRLNQRSIQTAVCGRTSGAVERGEIPLNRPITVSARIHQRSYGAGKDGPAREFVPWRRAGQADSGGRVKEAVISAGLRAGPHLRPEDILAEAASNGGLALKRRL
jgi:hypothetical protein